jgi:hypothetical protein
MGVVLGSLALLMVQHLSGGVWGIVPAAAVRGGGAGRCRTWRSVPADRVRDALDLRMVASRNGQRPDHSQKAPT